MNRKVSTDFAIMVIIAIAGFLIFFFWKENKNIGMENVSNKNIFADKNKECLKHAYDGEAKIKGWYKNENNNWVLHVAKEDVSKLPKGHEKSSLTLADGTPEMISKLKKATEKNPVEITIKGFYTNCEGLPMVSLDSGEKTFKKYLIKG